MQSSPVRAQAVDTCESTFKFASLPLREIETITKASARIGINEVQLDQIFKNYSEQDAQELRHLLSTVGRGTSIGNVTLIRAFLKLRLVESGSDFSLTPDKLLRILANYSDAQKTYLMSVLDAAFDFSIEAWGQEKPISNQASVTTAIRNLKWPDKIETALYTMDARMQKIGVPDPEEIAPGLTVVVTDPLTDAQVEQVKSVWDRLGVMIQGRLAMPKKILVDIGFRADNASDDADDGVLQTIYQFEKENILNPELLESKDPKVLAELKIRLERKHPRKTVPVFAHELGHAILGENIRQRVLAWGEQIDPIRDQMNQLRAEIKSQENKIGTLMQAASAETDPVKQGAIIATVKALRESLDDAAHKFPPLIKQLRAVSDITVAYNEFFADSVAVIEARDPDAIYNALHYTGDSPKEVARQKLRSFSARNGTSDAYNKDPHASLAQVRSHVGHRYYFTAPFASDRARVLSTVLDAIGKELQARMTQPKLKVMSNQEMNRRLIEKIDEEFKKWEIKD